jgi:hypothetical protein
VKSRASRRWVSVTMAVGLFLTLAVVLVVVSDRLGFRGPPNREQLDPVSSQDGESDAGRRTAGVSEESDLRDGGRLLPFAPREDTIAVGPSARLTRRITNGLG